MTDDLPHQEETTILNMYTINSLKIYKAKPDKTTGIN